MSTWDGGSPADAIREMVTLMRLDPTYGMPKPPMIHPLEQLRLVESAVELQEWEHLWQEAAVSRRAQIVMAPSRVLICWPDRHVDEVWLCD